MANTSEKKSNELPIPALASIVFASLAVLAQQLIPLESPRPTTPNAVDYFYRNIEDVNARLWQDPFTAITQHEKPCPDKDKCSTKQHHEITTLNDTKPITVLGVMVFGGPSAENVEWRRRTRYAVLSGLAVQGYAPQDAEHIGYFNMSEEDMKFLPGKIPFERFNADDADDSPILLLWLDETAFALTPLISTQKLVDEIKKINLNSTFKFIGPAGSGTLQVMVNELKTNPELGKTKEFEFYDVAASGDWPGMKIPLKNTKPQSHKTHLQLYLEEQKIPSLIIRTSLTDYQLATAMLEELKLRGIEIDLHTLCEKGQPFSRCLQQNNDDHIVMISEWDTVYGRTGLPTAMREALAPGSTDCGLSKGNKENCNKGNWIHQFSYMRGLDGVAPDGAKTKDEDKSKKEKDNTNNAKSAQERPEGDSQKDYLRRLTVQITELERDLEKKGEGNIAAIGLLGSDAYDKLMILKSLRSAFPKVIFFTTDLDTRLMHPEDFDVTRNLVVAASFGLQLDRNIQKSIPPFRDSYQTANFLATQIALTNVKGGRINQDTITKFLGNARIFENSHYKAIDLSDSGGNCKSLENFENCANVHPPVPTSLPDLTSFFIAFIIVACVLALACCLSECCRKITEELCYFVKQCIDFDRELLACSNNEQSPSENQQEKPPHWSALLLPQILVVLVIGVILFEISLGNKGEPFYWTAGVSVWPSEIIRLVAGILGCVFIAITIETLKSNKHQVSKDFFDLNEIPKHLENSSEINNEQEPSKLFDRLTELWKNATQMEPEWRIHKTDYIKKQVLVDALWRKYCGNTSAPLLNRWVISTAVLFMIFALALLFMFGFPNVPYRGNASLLANKLVLIFSVTVFVILVMTVIHATWCCVYLIKSLSEHTSVWPENTLHWFALRSNMGSKVKVPTDPTLEELCNELAKRDKFHLNGWLDIELIAAHTKVVGKLVYYPFVMLVLMMFARSKIFDYWDMPIGLALIFLSSAGLSVTSALYLRRAAEKERLSALQKIDDMKIALCLYPESDARNTLEKQIEIVTQKIKKINEGAFIPFTQEPAFQALLLPFGGWGGATLLEYFILHGF